MVTDPSKLEWRPASVLTEKYHVTLRTGVEVTSVDVSQKAVVLGASQERVAYNTLILATGGTPRKLPIDGKDLSNVFTLRDVADAKKIDVGSSDPSFR